VITSLSIAIMSAYKLHPSAPEASTESFFKLFSKGSSYVVHFVTTVWRVVFGSTSFNPLDVELNPICHLLALLGAHHIRHVSRIRVNLSVRVS